MFRTGGPAGFFIQPGNTDHLLRANEFLCRENIPFFLLNGGSNVLVSDAGLDVVVAPEIKNNFRILEKNPTKPDEWLVEAGAFTSNRFFSESAREQGLSGGEFLATIPGKLGGGIFQNAGCYGWDFSQIVHHIHLIDRGERISLSGADAGFGYRTSIFRENPCRWIESGVFSLKQADPESVKTRMDDYIQRRLQTQPSNRKSAGSVFKNPPGKKAWELIENAGLKGYRMGGAVISEKHANFILNQENATATDIYRMIRHIQETVYRETGIRLEAEISLLGDFTS